MIPSEFKKNINYLCKPSSSSITKKNLNQMIRDLQLPMFWRHRLNKSQTLIVLLILLIFQFSLYDFDIKEYTTNKPNIATHK